jgi:glycine/D-amino acid oxidase-like deaminating enzyme
MPAHSFGSVDVAIIGGGISGCSTALWLSRRGLKVAVFERGNVAGEQSSRAWGFIRQQGRHKAEVPLAAEATELWEELTREFGREVTQFTRGGILVPAETADDEERVVTGQEIAASYGIPTRLLSSAQIKDVAPELGGTWRAALYSEQDAHGEPSSSTLAIAAAAQSAGATIYEREIVREIRPHPDGSYNIIAQSGSCSAGSVVLASGIGTAWLARQLGINLPIQVIKSSVGRTNPVAPFTKLAVWGPKVAFRPRLDGSFIVGNGYRGVGADYEITVESFRNLRYFLPAYRNNWRSLRLRVGKSFFGPLARTAGSQADPLPEPVANMKKVEHNFAAFQRLFPRLDVKLDKVWAGRMDLTPDVVPIIDRPDKAKNLYIAAGFSGHGFALGPSVGKQIATWIMDGAPSKNLEEFRLSRFKEGKAQRSKQAL